EVIEKDEAIPSNSITLRYLGTLQNIEAYCILENNSNRSDCRWQEGNPPESYISETGDGLKQLSIWVRRKNIISDPVHTRVFVIDTTNPDWSNATLSHASVHNSLISSPSITFSDSAEDNLSTSKYEYAIGSSSGVQNRADIKNWTIVPSNPFKAGGLSLSDLQ